MKKDSTRLVERKVQKRHSSDRLVSFLSGLTFVSIMVGFAVVRSQSLFEEINEQLSDLLRISRSAVTQARFVVERINDINKLLRADKSTLPEMSPSPIIRGQLAGSIDRSSPDIESFGGIGSYSDKSKDPFEQSLEEYDRFWHELGTNKE